MGSNSAEINAGSVGNGYVDRSIVALGERETLVWTLAVLAALGDVVTTAYGLQVGLTEGNPVMHALIAQSGIMGLVGSKLLVIGLAFAIGTAVFDDNRRVVVPLGLAIPWLLVTATNAILLTA
jgi:hypothetical protein